MLPPKLLEARVGGGHVQTSRLRLNYRRVLLLLFSNVGRRWKEISRYVSKTHKLRRQIKAAERMENGRLGSIYLNSSYFCSIQRVEQCQDERYGYWKIIRMFEMSCEVFKLSERFQNFNFNF